MLNMQEKSEIKATLSANMCRLEQPSLSVEAEVENVVNTASPGRRSSWILASELMTPVRPTTGGLRTPESAPVRYDPSPVTQQYNHRSDLSVPPARWGDRNLQRYEDEEEVDLFQDALQPGGQAGGPIEQYLFMAQQDELNTASVPRPIQPPERSQPNLARCVDGRNPPPQPPRDDSLSTTCDSGTASISMPLPPPPPPPPSSSTMSTATAPQVYPLKWTPLGAKPKTPPGDPPSGSNNPSTPSGSAPNEMEAQVQEVIQQQRPF